MDLSAMEMSAGDFDVVRALVRDRTGVALEPEKVYLAVARLLPVVREEGLASLAELAAAVRRGPHGRLGSRVVEAMITNETLFFRDATPFEQLRTAILPALVRARAASRELTIWSAAASSGQEPYSIAMLLREHFPHLASWNVRLLATDVSQPMLARTEAGRYGQLEVNRGLPASLLVKYFARQGLDWVVKAELRRMLEVRAVNLIDPWPTLPPIDVLLLRNVLIYFDVDTRRAILRRVRQVLRPDGCLILGAAETTIGLDDAFEWIPDGASGCFRLKFPLGERAHAVHGG